MCKKNRYSELTFKELTESNYGYIKVYWNGKVVFDDDDRDDDLFEFKNKYDGKKVFEMHVKIVSCHHCILKVIGEDV